MENENENVKSGQFQEEVYNYKTRIFRGISRSLTAGKRLH